MSGCSREADWRRRGDQFRRDAAAAEADGTQAERAFDDAEGRGSRPARRSRAVARIAEVNPLAGQVISARLVTRLRCVFAAAA